MQKALSFAARLFLVVGSGVAAASPFLDPRACMVIWIALIPLWYAADGVSRVRAWWYGYIWGFVFFATTLYWLTQVTVLGAVALWAYLACYPAFFLLIVARHLHAFSAARALYIAAIWVLLEYARSVLLGGFAWELFGYALWKEFLCIQVAKVAGVWCISFFIVLVNIGLFYYLRNLKGHRKLYASKALIFALSAIALFLFLNIMAYAPCQEHSSASAAARVAVVQPNIPQDKKWDASFREHILSTLDTLTRAAAVKKADCIIWPEAALPGFLEYDEGVTDFFYSLVADIKVPLLAGMATFSREGARTLYFNSALLFSEGRYCGKYDKIHLVPFGEYIPFASLLPWLERLPRFNEIGNFSPGSEYTVFSVPCGGTAIRVSVLICFEDTVPCLSRTYARKGAQLIAVMTNDAWFKDTAAPFQHAQASVLRAVENGVWVARAANTGFSCIIGPDGKIRDYVRDSRGKAVFTQGSTAYDIPLNAPKATFYRMCGDWFILLLACGAGLLFLRDRNSF